MEIVTKFIIANKLGINTLHFLTAATARDQFAGSIPDLEVEEHITRRFNKDALIADLNNLSNQYLVVYADNEPAGYALMTTKGARPDLFLNRTMAKIADFSVLVKYNDPAISRSLLEKCLSVTKLQQVIWINVFEDHPYMSLFENYGFKTTNAITLPTDRLLPSVHLIKENH
jgi:hypothetical protein